MSAINRRDFLAGASAALCLCASCPAALGAEKPREPVDAGPLADFKADGITSKWAESHHFFIVRRNGRIYAPSAICTHKRFALDAHDKGFECSKHGSLFDLSGKAIKAPARRALPRLAVKVDEAGHLIVDPSRQFAEKQWGDRGAFVAV